MTKWPCPQQGPDPPWGFLPPHSPNLQPDHLGQGPSKEQPLGQPWRILTATPHGTQDRGLQQGRCDADPISGDGPLWLQGSKQPTLTPWLLPPTFPSLTCCNHKPKASSLAVLTITRLSGAPPWLASECLPHQIQSLPRATV